MSISALTYLPSVRRSVAATALDFELFEAAVALFDSGAFLESTHKVLEHLFPNQPAADLAQQPFSFVQGSSRVTVQLDGDVVSATVPIVRLPAGGGAVAALRYVLSRVNSTGQLYQARLRGDDLHLEFREKLAGLHPQKLVEVLRRMPIEADLHDDWMISQFGASPLERVTIEPLTDDEFAHAAEVWSTHWNDVEELLKEAQRKRALFFLNEVTAFALSRIRFAVPLGGSVLPRMMESASTFNNCNVDPMKRETTLAKCIKEMKALTRDELRQALGHAVYAIGPRTEGTAETLAGFFGPGDYIDAIGNYRSSGQSLDAALPLIGTYYYLLANHTWPPELEEEIKNGLAETSGKPWRDVATTLFTHAKVLVEKFVGDDEEDAEDEDDENEDGEESAEGANE